MNIILKSTACFCAFLCLFLFSCSDKKEELVDPQFPFTGKPVTKEQKINRFIGEHIHYFYLWTSGIDWTSMDPAKHGDSVDYFLKMKHKDDRWSMLTDNIEDLEGGFQGVSTTFGYNLIFTPASVEDKTYVGIIRFVYPNTPADQAGLKRGDLILNNNFKPITAENYIDLFTAASAMIQRGRIIDGNLSQDSTFIYMSAVSMYQDPMIKDTILEKGANKIGYLCYADFTMESKAKLLDVFTRFQSRGVTDVVLDLRYNGGGYASISQMIASILAPRAAVQSKDVFMKQLWNDNMAKLLVANGEKLDTYLVDTFPVNLNLNRLYILTLRNSASASEATLVGLKPYMEVIQIGDTTSGKYCGGSLFSGSLWDEKKKDFVEEPIIKNWGMYLMTFRFSNKNGISSFTGGLAPNHYVPENDIANFFPFGDERDPLLGKAVELITGSPAKTRSGSTGIPMLLEPSMHQPRTLDGKLIQSHPAVTLEMSDGVFGF